MQDLERRTDGGELRVKCGMWVKIGMRTERFWCRVTAIREDGTLLACVDNDLVHLAYRCGDVIELLACHVLESADSSDLAAFYALATKLGPTGAAMVWQQKRSQTGLAVADKPNTCFVVSSSQ